MNAGNGEVDFDAIPPDFPRPVHLGAVSGFQPKLLLTKHEGKFYAPGCTPPELFERWDACEELAQKISVKAMASKLGKRSHMTEEAILAQYLLRLNQTGWGSPAEMAWIIKRMAIILGWNAPE